MQAPWFTSVLSILVCGAVSSSGLSGEGDAPKQGVFERALLQHRIITSDSAASGLREGNSDIRLVIEHQVSEKLRWEFVSLVVCEAWHARIPREVEGEILSCWMLSKLERLFESEDFQLDSEQIAKLRLAAVGEASRIRQQLARAESNAPSETELGGRQYVDAIKKQFQLRLDDPFSDGSSLVAKLLKGNDTRDEDDGTTLLPSSDK